VLVVNHNLADGVSAGLPPIDVVFGRSPTMQAIRVKVEKIAGTNVPVLLQGKSGTGKEILSRVIHATSKWGSGPFVKVNCAAIPGTLLESELFGYQRGAFTGALTSKPGRVELAHDGTLLLDEIGELDKALQAKVLQLLQDGQFRRIGDEEDRRVNARVICTTNRNLQEEIISGNFREDLFYRINVISIRMPELSKRREDITGLVEYFLNQFNRIFQRNVPAFSSHAMRNFETADWPGNIRELENLVARYVVLGTEESLYHSRSEGRSPASPSMLAESWKGHSIPLKRIAKDAVYKMERDLILRVLQANHWNRRHAAKALKISYRALIYKIRAAGLSQRSAGRAKDTTTPAPELPAREPRNATNPAE
jgi:two-component system, NtrC family, response regulator AtoC